jgi:hypothetical protein
MTTPEKFTEKTVAEAGSTVAKAAAAKIKRLRFINRFIPFKN